MTAGCGRVTVLAEALSILDLNPDVFVAIAALIAYATLVLFAVMFDLRPDRRAEMGITGEVAFVWAPTLVCAMIMLGHALSPTLRALIAR